MEKVFITKYALTGAITEHDVVDYFDGQRVKVKWVGGHNNVAYFPKNDWHHTKDGAIARAEEMRIKKLQALDRQFKKLWAKKFD